MQSPEHWSPRGTQAAPRFVDNARVQSVARACRELGARKSVDTPASFPASTRQRNPRGRDPAMAAWRGFRLVRFAAIGKTSGRSPGDRDGRLSALGRATGAKQTSQPTILPATSDPEQTWGLILLSATVHTTIVSLSMRSDVVHEITRLNLAQTIA